MKAQAENGKNSLTESKNLAFWKIKKKKRNSNYLYYVPGTKTEGTSQPSKSPVCKLFNVWDRNQKIMLPETRWKKRHISKFEHILHCLGSVLSHWMRGAPVDLASVENNCIPHKVSEGMFVFEATFWLCLCGGGGGLVQLLHEQQHCSLLLKLHITPQCFDTWAVCFLRQSALILSFNDFWLSALPDCWQMKKFCGMRRVGSSV